MQWCLKKFNSIFVKNTSLISVDASEKIDVYISSASEIGQVILARIRHIIHSLGIDIREEWKWNAPNFSYRGLICMTWSFKKHVTLHFFQGALLSDPYKVLQESEGGNVQTRFLKFFAEEDLNEEIIRAYVLEAAMLNEIGIKRSIQKKDRPEPEIPKALSTALSKNKSAKKCFEKLSASHRREHILYISGAKKEQTQIRRVELTIQKLLKHQDK